MMASTGVIGELLPDAKITARVPEIARQLSPGAWEDAARAIMTTDTFPKGATATARLGKAEVTICGIAKGAGMIAPDMATMLSFVFTDANNWFELISNCNFRLFSDDVVGLILDTYQDRQHAFEFFVNPFGVQADAIETEVQGDDYSFDTLWYSDGRLVPDGYAVLISVPSFSLVFWLAASFRRI